MPSDTVHRLRGRIAPGVDHHDALAWRLRLSGLLDRTTLHPPGLPPSAILVVRALTAAVPPGAVARGGAGASHGAWERAVRERLAACHRAAARPVRGRVPADAEAVVFADVAEWLACLLADAGRGAAPRWWWPPRLRARSAAAAFAGPLVALLCDEARAVPPAMAHLVHWGEAARAFRVLPSAEAEPVLRAVIAAYGVAGTEARVRVEGEGRVPRVAAGAGERAGEVPEDAPPASGIRHRIPPRVSATLAPSQARLLALSLVLVHGADAPRPAPPRVGAETSPASDPPGRTGAALGVGASESRARGNAEASGFPSPPASSPDGGQASRAGSHEGALRPVATDGRRGPAETRRADVAAGGRTRGARRESVPPAPPPEASRQGRPGGTDGAGEDPRGGAREKAGAPLPGFPSSVPVAATPSRPSPAVVEPIQGTTEGEEPDAGAAISFEHGIETRLGGALYLLNLLTHLDVPAAFEAWRRRGAMGPWALLDVVARGLLDDEPGLQDDPLWDVLAELDRRPSGMPPGVGVSGRSAVTLPDRWGEAADGVVRDWRWASREGRVCVWSGEGYPVALATRDRRAGAVQALSLLGARGRPTPSLRRRPFAAAPLDPLTGPLASTLPAPLRPWLAVALPFLRHRLRRALGPDVRVADVLRRPGRLYVTSSHVDLVQPVEAIALAVRRAGLDRDPGWLPAFGRVVYFHFDGPERLLR